VSQYQKGKTNLDFTGARDNEWQWHQLGHIQVCTSLQTDNHTSTPPLSFFTGQMPFLPPNQQRQSTEGMEYLYPISTKRKMVMILTIPFSTKLTHHIFRYAALLKLHKLIVFARKKRQDCSTFVLAYHCNQLIVKRVHVIRLVYLQRNEKRELEIVMCNLIITGAIFQPMNLKLSL